VPAEEALELEVELLAIQAPDGLASQARAVVFDLDPVSLVSLREALPDWEIQSIQGATVTSLVHAWNPGAADLLVVGVRDNPTDTLGLCRFLAYCTSFSTDSRPEDTKTAVPRTDAALLVLVLPGQEALVQAALEAGADSCLLLPIHPKEVATMLAHARAGHRPGQHALNLNRASGEDCWRDCGGEE